MSGGATMADGADGAGDGQAETLTRLMMQAEAKGADLVALRAIAEEASELGAARALWRLGLTDAKARGDIDALRELLAAWRDAKRSAVQAVVTWAVRGLCALLLVALAVKAGLAERLLP